jgi:hypothetical protein
MYATKALRLQEGERTHRGLLKLFFKLPQKVLLKLWGAKSTNRGKQAIILELIG